MAADETPLDGALVAVVSNALHQQCVRHWEAQTRRDPGRAQTIHPPQAHDHGALDVVAALRAQGWICHHRKEGVPRA